MLKYCKSAVISKNSCTFAPLYDILKLLEIKMQRILKYNKDKADELLMKIKAELAEIENDLALHAQGCRP